MPAYICHTTGGSCYDTIILTSHSSAVNVRNMYGVWFQFTCPNPPGHVNLNLKVVYLTPILLPYLHFNKDCDKKKPDTLRKHNIMQNKSCVWRPLLWWVYRLRNGHQKGRGQSVNESIDIWEDRTKIKWCPRMTYLLFDMRPKHIKNSPSYITKISCAETGMFGGIMPIPSPGHQ